MREGLHDLNNQLAVILNFTAFLLEDTAADDPRREDLLEARQAAERARDLVVELLARAPADGR